MPAGLAEPRAPGALQAGGPIRVLHVQKVIKIAGSEKHLLSLLPRLREHGVDPVMAVLAQEGTEFAPFVAEMRARGVPTEVVPIHGRISPGVVRGLAALLRRQAHHVVHTHLMHADLYGCLAARRCGVPVLVSSRHNDDEVRRRLPLRLLNGWLASRAQCTVCISENVRRFVRRVEFVAADRTELIPYGFAPGPARPADRSWRRALGLDDGAPVVGIVARLTAQKGHSTLLDAMPLVRARVPGAQLVVVGDGELRGELRDQAARLGLAQCVHLLGWRDDADALMAGFDVFAHPSRWEGFGLVFLEAMAAAVPVVATRAGAIPEVVADGETGLLVPPDDAPALAAALVELLRDPARARAMGLAGRVRLREHFSEARMVERTAALYRRLLRHAADAAR